MTRMTLVLGVHRSGTSLLTAGLQALGLDLGPLPVERDIDNPRGYFENHVIRSFNDRLLENLGTSWSDSHFRAEMVGLDGPAWADWRDKAAALLQAHYGGRAAVALKDPRITQLLPFWTTVLKDLGWDQHHVLILRHPDEVTESQMQRVGRRPERFPGMDTRPAMYALWTTLMRTVLATLAPDERITVRHDALLADPKGVLRALSDRLAVSPDPVALARFAQDFVDPALYRAQVLAPVPSEERDMALDLWKSIVQCESPSKGRASVSDLPPGRPSL